MFLLSTLVLFTHRMNISKEIARIAGHHPVRTSIIQMHKGSNEEV